MNFQTESVHQTSTLRRIRFIRGTTKHKTIGGTTDLTTQNDCADVEAIAIEDEVDLTVTEVTRVETTTDSTTQK